MKHRLVIAGVFVVAGILGAIGNSMFSAYAADTQNAVTAQNQIPQATPDKSQGGHVGANGVREELLTGDTAEKARAASLKAVPDGTIDRLETDAEGSPYEAHMRRSDGTRVTVKFDSNFNVTSTEDGMR